MIEIKHYTKDQIPDVLQFERDLRSEENFWGLEIDEKYIVDVTASFENPAFANCLSLLAYMDGKVADRIDSTKICSHFDGSAKAYLDWICVIKSCRHKGSCTGADANFTQRTEEPGSRYADWPYRFQ